VTGRSGIRRIANGGERNDVIAAIANGATLADASVLLTEYSNSRWYAAYTSANHEKRVALQLGQRSVEHFLPVYESVRHWKDRRVKLELPLFPGYVFVRLALHDRLRVLQVPGVAKLVGFSGAPTPLADEEIEGLRRALTEGLRVEPHPYLKVGRPVRILTGPFASREGILKRWKGNFRVLLSIELIQRSILVDVDASSVVPFHPSKLVNSSSESCRQGVRADC
jgi:transcription antitermination factor NusG